MNSSNKKRASYQAPKVIEMGQIADTVAGATTTVVIRDGGTRIIMGFDVNLQTLEP